MATVKKDPLLWASLLDEKGGASEYNGQKIDKWNAEKGPLWVHLDRNHEDAEKYLTDKLGLEPIIVEALLTEETRPRLNEFDNGYLVILRGVNVNENAEPEDMISIRIWVEKNRIISLRGRPVMAAIGVKERLDHKKGPRDIGAVVSHILEMLTDRMENVLSVLKESIDDAEEKVLNKPDASFRKIIIDIRQQAIIFRRYIGPQKDVAYRMSHMEDKWIDSSHRKHMSENYERILRFVEDLDAIRERSQIVQDELTNALSDAINRNMYIMSLIASIFLPLTFLTGLLGMNVDGIPMAHHPFSFWIVCVFMFLVLIMQLIWFKGKHWL